MKKTMPQYKAVRDKIPEIIEQDGQKPVFKILSEKQFYDALCAKLNEERMEFVATHKIEELVDMLEVIYALAKIQNYPPETLEDMRQQKAEKRGGFSKRIYLEAIEADV